jgi:hypothetical protein
MYEPSRVSASAPVSRSATANITFLIQSANLWVAGREPAEYFPEVEKPHPGALESHWIPMDERLWKAENYLDFLAARRELLAQTANQFLDTLLKGGIPEEKPAVSILEKPAPVVADVEDEGKLLAKLNQWLVRQGLPATLSPLRRQNPREEPGASAAHAGICAGVAGNGRPYRDPSSSSNDRPISRGRPFTQFHASENICSAVVTASRSTLSRAADGTDLGPHPSVMFARFINRIGENTFGVPVRC